MSTNNAAATTTAAKPAKIERLIFSKSIQFDLNHLSSELGKLAGYAGSIEKRLGDDSQGKEMLTVGGNLVKVPTADGIARYVREGKVTKEEAENLRFFTNAIKALAGIATFTQRKALNEAKRKMK